MSELGEDIWGADGRGLFRAGRFDQRDAHHPNSVDGSYSGANAFDPVFGVPDSVLNPTDMAGNSVGPVGGYVRPEQTYTGATGHTMQGDISTPTGGGSPIPVSDNTSLMQIARPDLQGTGQAAFQASQFDQVNAPSTQAPVQTSNSPYAGLPEIKSANPLAQSLRNFNAGRTDRAQQQQNFNGVNAPIGPPPNVPTAGGR